MYNDPNQPPQQNPYEVPLTQYARPPYNPSQYGVPSSSYEPTQYAPPPPYEPTQHAPPPPPFLYNSPLYGGSSIPNYGQAVQQPKRSLRWVWITLSIVGAVLVLSYVGSIILNTLTPTAAATNTANAYYHAIENKDYANAYNYLSSDMQTGDGQSLTLSLYTNIAQTQDLLLGPVTSFSQSSVSMGNGKVSITLSVTRNGNSYVVYLQLQQYNGNWQITQYNTI